jgi:urease subunit gamma/beta
MFLTPKEKDKLLVSWAAEIARRRRNKGLKLNHPESVAVITDFIMEAAREGKPMTDLISEAQRVLNEDDVMEGVPDMIDVLQVECTFPDGTKLVTIRDPIKSKMHQEWVRFGDGEIDLGTKEKIELEVTNTGDRPIQVGSHFHFFEVNRVLKLDRPRAYGMALDIPSGTSVRFEPGTTMKVTLRGLRGKRVITGLNGLTEGPLDQNEDIALKRAAERRFV